MRHVIINIIGFRYFVIQTQKNPQRKREEDKLTRLCHHDHHCSRRRSSFEATRDDFWAITESSDFLGAYASQHDPTNEFVARPIMITREIPPRYPLQSTNRAFIQDLWRHLFTWLISRPQTSSWFCGSSILIHLLFSSLKWQKMWLLLCELPIVCLGSRNCSISSELDECFVQL